MLFTNLVSFVTADYHQSQQTGRVVFYRTVPKIISVMTSI